MRFGGNRQRHGMCPWTGLTAFAALILLAAAVAPRPTRSGVPYLSSRLPASWAVADLDGDHRADLLQTRLAGRGSYSVEFQLSESGRMVSIPVQTLGYGLSVVARDVDGDRDTDLIISEPGSLNPLGVWINEGDGRFRRTAAPRRSTERFDDLPQDAAAGAPLLAAGDEFQRNPGCQPAKIAVRHVVFFESVAAARSQIPAALLLTASCPPRAPPSLS